MPRNYVPLLNTPVLRGFLKLVITVSILHNPLLLYLEHCCPILIFANLVLGQIFFPVARMVPQAQEDYTLNWG